MSSKDFSYFLQSINFTFTNYNEFENAIHNINNTHVEYNYVQDDLGNSFIMKVITGDYFVWYIKVYK